jgi:hypothetical protein
VHGAPLGKRLVEHEGRQAIQRRDQDGPPLDLDETAMGQLMELAREGLGTDVEVGGNQRLGRRQDHDRAIERIGAAAALLEQEVGQPLTCAHQATGFQIVDEPMDIAGNQLEHDGRDLGPFGDGRVDALAADHEDPAVADRLGEDRAGLVEQDGRDTEDTAGLEDVQHPLGPQRRERGELDPPLQKTLETARAAALLADDLAPCRHAQLTAAGDEAGRLVAECGEGRDVAQVRQEIEGAVAVVHS